MKLNQPYLAALALLLSTSLFVSMQTSRGANYAAAGRSQAPAPVTDRARGIELYEKGDDLEAIKALRAAVKQRQDDLGAWYYLGLASERQKKNGDARKAFEKTVKLGDALLSSQLDALAPSRSPKSLQPINLELRQAAESAAKYIQLAKPSKSKLDEWTSRAAYLQDLAELSSASNADPTLHDVFMNRDVTTKARVLAKPEARYTGEAREHQTMGTVVLRCIFAADGRVRALFPLRSLPHGLTLEAIKAARRIKFVPANKDGRAVSVFMQLEYTFNLY